MAVATTFDLPQYVGRLFLKQERPNAILRLIGGLTSIMRFVDTKKFAMGVDYTLAAAAQPAILEGANPAGSQQDVTAQASNVVQIFQETVEINYSRLGHRGALSGLAVIPGGGNEDPIQTGTFEWQLAKKIEKIARDLNFSVLRGAYQEPADNTTARKMRGIYTAIATNDDDVAAAALTKARFEQALRTFMNNGMFNQGDEIFALVDATQFQKLHDLYVAVTALPQSRTVAGVGIRTIVTPYCNVNITWEPDATASEITLVRPEKYQLVAMPIPGKGVLFSEELPQTGSALKHQVYGELGIDYTHEIFAGKVRNYT